MSVRRLTLGVAACTVLAITAVGEPVRHDPT